MRVSAGQKSFFINLEVSVLLTACQQSPPCDLAAVAWGLLHACLPHGLQHALDGSDIGSLADWWRVCCQHLSIMQTMPLWLC